MEPEDEKMEALNSLLCTVMRRIGLSSSQMEEMMSFMINTYNPKLWDILKEDDPA